MTNVHSGQISKLTHRAVAQRLLRWRFLHLRSTRTEPVPQLLGLLFQDAYGPMLNVESQVQFSLLIEPVPGNTQDQAPPLKLPDDWNEYLKTDISMSARGGVIGDAASCLSLENVIQRLIGYEFMRRRAAASASTSAEILHAMFAELFDADEAPSWRKYFFFRSARVARAAILCTTPPDTPMGGSTVGEILSWMRWLDEKDPMDATMCDLYYFGGFRIKEIGKMLRMPPSSVLRSVRSQKDAVLLKLQDMQAIASSA